MHLWLKKNNKKTHKPFLLLLLVSMFFMIAFTQIALHCSPLTAFGAVFGPFGVHICIQTAPNVDFNQMESEVLGGPEFTFLLFHFRVQFAFTPP